MFDLVIIGAGPAGCMCAITAARAGATVLVLERNDKPLKKLLATGNGKCNFTNEYMEASCFHGDSVLLSDVLSQFTGEDTLDFFHEIGIYPKNKNGYYYPSSEQASSVVSAITTEMQHIGIAVKTGSSIEGIEKQKQCFEVVTKEGAFTARAVVIACGLMASPKLGSDGSMFGNIKELGHRFMPIVPALCGFYCSGADFKHLAGVRVSASVRAYVEDICVAEDTGELQLTEYGISGIPVFQVSRFLSVALYEKKKAFVYLSFLPELEGFELKAELQNRIVRTRTLEPDKAIGIESLLNGLLPQKLSRELEHYILHRTSGRRIADKELESLLFDAIRNRRIIVEKPREYEFAQVCAGGIRTEDICTHTLESKLVPGLFFAGEVLDVDGICGGYNLQWAWSSGYVAGNYAIKYRK